MNPEDLKYPKRPKMDPELMNPDYLKINPKCLKNQRKKHRTSTNLPPTSGKSSPIKHVGFAYNWFQCAYHKNWEIWISFRYTSNNYTSKGPNCDICMATKKKAINLAN